MEGPARIARWRKTRERWYRCVLQFILGSFGDLPFSYLQYCNACSETTCSIHRSRPPTLNSHLFPKRLSQDPWTQPTGERALVFEAPVIVTPPLAAGIDVGFQFRSRLTLHRPNFSFNRLPLSVSHTAPISSGRMNLSSSVVGRAGFGADYPVDLVSLIQFPGAALSRLP